MKKVNFNQPVREIDGSPVIVPGEGEIMLKNVIVRCLGQRQHEGDLDKTFDAYKLAQKIHSSDEDVDLSEKEITIIKSSLNHLGVIVAGQIIELLA